MSENNLESLLEKMMNIIEEDNERYKAMYDIATKELHSLIEYTLDCRLLEYEHIVEEELNQVYSGIYEDFNSLLSIVLSVIFKLSEITEEWSDKFNIDIGCIQSFLISVLMLAKSVEMLKDIIEMPNNISTVINEMIGEIVDESKIDKMVEIKSS